MQMEVAEEIGISQANVSRLENNAFIRSERQSDCNLETTAGSAALHRHGLLSNQKDML